MIFIARINFGNIYMDFYEPLILYGIGGFFMQSFAPLTQWQSNRPLTGRLWVQIPCGAFHIKNNKGRKKI